MTEEQLSVPLLGHLPSLSQADHELQTILSNLPKGRVAFGVSSTQSSRILWSWGLCLCPQHSWTPGRLCPQVNEIRSTEIGRIHGMEARCGLARAGEGLS